MFSEGERLMLDRWHNSMPGLSIDALEILWEALKIEATRCLAVERKPVDLGFVKIIPVPYRQNWKELLIAKGEAFHDAIDDPKLMAIGQRGFIRWTVECLPAVELLQNIDANECARKEELGTERYSAAILYDDVPDTMRDVIELVNLHYENSQMPAPWKVTLKYEDPPGNWRNRIFKQLLVRKSEVDGCCRINPNPSQASAPGSNTASQEDKKSLSPESNTNSRSSETAPDPLPAELPADTGEATG